MFGFDFFCSSKGDFSLIHTADGYSQIHQAKIYK